jgi:AraC-like DNA-binding protein
MENALRPAWMVALQNRLTQLYRKKDCILDWQEALGIRTCHIVFQHNRDHNDKQILAIQKLIEEKYSNSLHPELLAKDYGMSRLTFERRSRKATGHAPVFASSGPGLRLRNKYWKPILRYSMKFPIKQALCLSAKNERKENKNPILRGYYFHLTSAAT